LKNHIQYTEPKLFLFNPTSEMAIANGEVAWQPNRILQQFEKDLELLPYIFAQNNDYIVVNDLPASGFLNTLRLIRNISPTYLLKATLKDEHIIQKFKNLDLQPWGWSPASHHLLKNLKQNCSNAFRISPNYKWNNSHKNIVSRKFSTKLLSEIINKNPTAPYIPERLHPKATSSISEIQDYINQWNQVVLKAPWSSSGRGVQMLRYAELNKSNIQWISGIIKQQGFIMIEPLLEKLEDFSLQFHISQTEIQFLGVGKFETNTNGQYVSNKLNPETQFIEDVIHVDQLTQHIINILKQEKIQEKYEGYAGFDLMTIQYENHTLIHPCVEVNWRYNMGLVALQLQKLIHPQAKGEFSVFFDPKRKFKHFAEKALQKHPIEKIGSRLIKGFVPLSDPEKSVSGAYILLD
jgi:hypothetical protein